MSHASETDVSIVDTQLIVEGELSTKGRLVVKGEVRGTIAADTLVIAREGRVFASAKVGRMTIGGFFQGEVVATQMLVILATGNCSGKVTCKNFLVEAGGVLNADVSSLS